jgi:hypothetical protein
MAKTEQKPSPLYNIYPGYYRENDKTRWIALPEDLIAFLFATRKSTTVRLVLALLQARDWSTMSFEVEVTNEKLAEKTRLHQRNVWRALQDEDFTSIVTVLERGVPRRARVAGKPGKYMVEDVFVALAKWKYQAEQEAAQLPAEETPTAELELVSVPGARPVVKNREFTDAEWLTVWALTDAGEKRLAS